MIGARGGAVGWGTALQIGRSRVRFPMVSLEFLIDIILPAALWPLGMTQPVTEMSTRNISCGGKSGRCGRPGNLTTFMCWLSWNLGTWTFRNPQDLSGPVIGLLYLFKLKMVTRTEYLEIKLKKKKTSSFNHADHSFTIWRVNVKKKRNE